MPQNRKPVLMLFTHNALVRDYFYNSINDVIGDVVDVQRSSVESKSYYEHMPDLVVSSADYTYEPAKKAFPGIPVLKLQRTFSGIGLDQVLAIPPGSRVLIVSTPREASEENITLLRQLGLTHLIYEPYWQGRKINPEKFEYAVSPGMFSYCPYTFPHMIDLGQKIISVCDFTRILNLLNIDLRYGDVFEYRTIRNHIDTSRKVVQALEHSENLRRIQAALLHEIDDAVIALNSSGELIICSPRAQDFFGNSDVILHNRDLQAAMHVLDSTQSAGPAAEEIQSTETILLTIRGDAFFCRRSVLQITGQSIQFYTFRRAQQIQEMEQSLRRKLYQKGFSARYHFKDVWGSSPKSVRMIEKAHLFAEADQAILIEGESGTGKELLAQAIHNASPRAKGPFVAVNLSAIPETLVESELFGYQEGAFTGAKKGGKPGFFEIAHEGTLFLDEIGDVPMALQVLLLRVLEERTFMRVGGDRYIPISARVIAATNRPLEEMVRNGTFRSDLYYRLNVLSIVTSPLRGMKDEIPSFVSRYFDTLFGEEKTLSESAVSVLTRYDWPGNFRELKNVVEYLHYTTVGRTLLERDDLPEYLLRSVSPDTDGLVVAGRLDLLDFDPLMPEALRIFAAATPSGVGRSVLAERLSYLSGETVSESRVRRILSLLHEHGLIRSGTTRQGSFLTDFGRAYCKEL